eukprot:279523-Chlamydomonas_euryale.AAC.1
MHPNQQIQQRPPWRTGRGQEDAEAVTTNSFVEAAPPHPQPLHTLSLDTRSDSTPSLSLYTLPTPPTTTTTTRQLCTGPLRP